VVGGRGDLRSRAFPLGPAHDGGGPRGGSPAMAGDVIGLGARGGQEAERRTGETGRFSVVRPDIENRPEAGYNNNSMMILGRGRRFLPLPLPRCHERVPGIHPGFICPN
jgi:hypothetical protein